MVYDESVVLAGGMVMKKRMKIIFLAAILVLTAAGCGKSKETEEKQMALRSQGMEQALNGEYEEAVASYNEALQLADLHGAGTLELDIAAYKASAQYHGGDTEGAVDTFTAILELKESAESYLARGLLYRSLGKTQAANADFAAAAELTSDKDKVMLGRLSYYMEDYTKAKEYLDAAAGTGDPEAVFWQAELYWQTGNQDYALSLYRSYLEGDAQHQSAYVKVVNSQMEQGDYDGALATLEAGIAKGDGEGLKELLANEVAVYEQKGDFETARQKMESYLEKYPEDEAAAREYEFLRSR